MIISEKIFYLLDKNGMSQKDFATQTGISQSTISDWKRKKTNPSADKILKICEVLHVTPYELLSERETTADEGVEYQKVRQHLCDEILDYLFSREGVYSKSYILSCKSDFCACNSCAYMGHVINIILDHLESRT